MEKNSQKLSPEREHVTQLLQRWTSGDDEAGERMIQALYRELHVMAQSALRGERRHHTLQPTALVNEAYMRLVDLERIQWQDRDHFLRAAAKTMRRVLVDHARQKKRVKRGSGMPHLPFDEADAVEVTADDDLEALDEALDKLAELDPKKAEMVELRFFGGYSVEQTAELLGISRATVARQWRLARVWLRNFMA